MDHNKLWKIRKEMGIQVYLTCLLRNFYAFQEATVRIRHGTRTGSKLGKKYCHLVYLTYMQSASCEMVCWREDSQAGIKIARRNINNLRHEDDNTLMAEGKVEL